MAVRFKLGIFGTDQTDGRLRVVEPGQARTAVAGRSSATFGRTVRESPGESRIVK